MTVEDVAAASQFIGLVLILRGEEVDHQNRITNAADGIDPGCQLETDVIGDKGAITQSSQLLQGLHTRTAAAVKVLQTFFQQTAVGPCQGCHIGHGADAEQIPGVGNRFGPVHL